MIVLLSAVISLERVVVKGLVRKRSVVRSVVSDVHLLCFSCDFDVLFYH